MEWKKEKLKFDWKINKEKLIFLFCSGLLLFILSIPNGGKAKQEAGRSQTEAMGRGIAGSSMTGNSMAEGGMMPGSTAKGSTENGGTGETALKDALAAKEESSYEKELEKRIKDILSRVEGVGGVDVMVVLKSSEEKVLHVDKNTSSSVTEEQDEGGTRRNIQQQELSENTVLSGSSGGSGPIIEKELRPEISGIIISADGGGSSVIKAEISEAMEALFGLPANKIKVLKRVPKN